MAKVDLKYYSGFSKWWFSAITQAAASGDLVAVKSLADGGRRVIDLLTEPFQEFPESRKLSLSTAMDFYQWAKVNKDPFKPALVIIEKLKQDHIK